jgi:hypothetical protein
MSVLSAGLTVRQRGCRFRCDRRRESESDPPNLTGSLRRAWCSADQAEFGMQPGFEGVENGPALLLPDSAPLIGATPPTLGLDGIEFSDAFEWLAGNRCGTADSKLVRQLARRRDDGHEPSRRRAAPCHPWRARNSRHSRPPAGCR